MELSSALITFWIISQFYSMSDLSILGHLPMTYGRPSTNLGKHLWYFYQIFTRGKQTQKRTNKINYTWPTYFYYIDILWHYQWCWTDNTVYSL